MLNNQCQPLSVSESENEYRSDDESMFPTPNIPQKGRKQKKSTTDNQALIQQNQISKLQDELKGLSFKFDTHKSTKNNNVFDDQQQEMTLYKNQYNTI